MSNLTERAKDASHNSQNLAGLFVARFQSVAIVLSTVASPEGAPFRTLLPASEHRVRKVGYISHVQFAGPPSRIDLDERHASGSTPLRFAQSA